ncbi:hypothetical protein [Mycolicibacterium holsaticum]|uniref:hypothetical protein n=1 Tax=Mycolicibacterium holsaticum TaxID=152142 RepID=UPI000ABE1D66|nr:hypothetical protein [Mycolicibacterium holsaticum]
MAPKRTAKWICYIAASVGTSLASLVPSPTAHADESVTYEVFSRVVPMVAKVEYRDLSGKHSLHGVPLPFHITVPVADALSPTGIGGELRADWRPNFRTAATVGRVLQGQFVTVRISSGGKTICESTLDVGNATCYGSVPHRPGTTSSYDRGPLFPEQTGFLP